jgi:signal transduction histidine kinase
MLAPPDPHFLSLVIHDLRNPLNAIGMALHMIEGELPDECEELRKDVAMIAESTRALRRMLRVLSDYNALTTHGLRKAGHLFDPRRLAADVVAHLSENGDASTTRIHLEIEPDAPGEALLDQTLAGMALFQGLSNAADASAGAEVRVRVSGEGGRWITRIVTEQPPAESVAAESLRPEEPYRLVGTALERRGLDLCIVARISELFNGEARLEVEPGLRSTLVLDWALRLAEDGNRSSQPEPTRTGRLSSR